MSEVSITVCRASDVLHPFLLTSTVAVWTSWPMATVRPIYFMMKKKTMRDETKRKHKSGNAKWKTFFEIANDHNNGLTLDFVTFFSQSLLAFRLWNGDDLFFAIQNIFFFRFWLKTQILAVVNHLVQCGTAKHIYCCFVSPFFFWQTYDCKVKILLKAFYYLRFENCA